MARLEGKVALVTGCSRGLGREIVRLFAKEGARVVASDIDAAGGAETVELAREDGGDAVFAAGDVASGADVETMVRTAVDTYGRLDILVNNAAIDGDYGPTHEVEEKSWDKVIDVDLKGVFLPTKAALAQFVRQNEGGSIVNVSSVAAEHGWTLAAYSAAKAGMLGLTKVTAVEYGAAGIRVNAVKPGLMLTEMAKNATASYVDMNGGAAGAEDPISRSARQNPSGRGAEPIEVAYAVLFLASDEASYVNGVVLPVDGGWTAKLSEEASAPAVPS